MRKKHLLLIAAFLLIGTVAFASNMGFKVSIHCGDGSAMQTWFSLPYNVSYSLASAIRTDIINGGGTCNAVYRWDSANDTLVYYVRGGTDFSIDPTQAYMVVTTSTFDWVVVGSHDPAGVVTVDVSGTANQTWISVPYHATSTTASALRTEMIADGVNVNSVYKWDAANDTLVYYVRGGTDFNITPGMGIMVVCAETTGTSWTPAHY
ncbi:hypothetical protein JXQ70_16765 [bacterium]|nr:hypothetical protein [bacterium]